MFGDYTDIPPCPDGVDEIQWSSYWYAFNAKLEHKIEQKFLLMHQVNQLVPTKVDRQIKKPFPFEAVFVVGIVVTSIAIILGYGPVQELLNKNLTSTTGNVIKSSEQEEVKEGEVIGDWVVTTGWHEQRSYGNHAALDLAKSTGQTEGSPLYMPFNGKVEFVTDDNCGNGARLTTKESQESVVLCHLQNPPKQGEIKQGEVFANVGNTGRSTGPHLHVQTRDAQGNPVHTSKELVSKLIGQ